jgi:replication-associated recombination protein RarA
LHKPAGGLRWRRDDRRTRKEIAPDKLWRRIGCIAYEDVGVASLEAVGLATAALAGKRHRAALGGEWEVASCVVAALSEHRSAGHPTTF